MNQEYEIKPKWLTTKKKFELALGIIFILMTVPFAIADGRANTRAMKDGTLMSQYTSEVCQAILDGKSELQTVKDGINTVVDMSPGFKVSMFKECADYQPQEVTIQATEVIPRKIGGIKKQNEIIAYEWEISGHDKEFIYLLLGEDGTVNPNRVHPKAEGSTGIDYGVCGTNGYYHPEIIADPRFKDWKWQVDRCYQMYSGGVTFHGDKEKGKAQVEWVTK